MGLFPIISSLSHSVTVYFSSVHKSINWANRRAVGFLTVHFRWLLFMFWPQGSLCFRSQLPVRSLMFRIGKSMFLFIFKVAHHGYHTDHVELKDGCFSHPFIAQWLKVCWGCEFSKSLLSSKLGNSFSPCSLPHVVIIMVSYSTVVRITERVSHKDRL